MANVLKVFLENGQTKSFKYDTTTTVQVRYPIPYTNVNSARCVYCALACAAVDIVRRQQQRHMKLCWLTKHLVEIAEISVAAAAAAATHFQDVPPTEWLWTSDYVVRTSQCKHIHLLFGLLWPLFVIPMATMLLTGRRAWLLLMNECVLQTWTCLCYVYNRFRHKRKLSRREFTLNNTTTWFFGEDWANATAALGLRPTTPNKSKTKIL